MSTNKIMLIGVILLIIGIATWYYTANQKPKNVIEKNMKFKLPQSSEIIKYSREHSFFNKFDYFDVKIKVSTDDKEYLTNELEKLLGEKINNKKKPYIYNFKNTTDWWDLDKDKVDFYYESFYTPKKTLLEQNRVKTSICWACIYTDDSGNEFIYISRFE